MRVKLVLLRGIPGSGKSTLAKSMKNFIRLETDMFWGPEYKFDASKLPKAHDWCLRKCAEHMNSIQKILDIHNKYNKNPTNGVIFPPPTLEGIVVSNTFVTKESLRPYFRLAKDYNVKPSVFTCQGKFTNVHHVPVGVIERMKSNFEFDIQSLYEESYD
jgi:energy-coupling factor transporter ATP-binding protein EcfA2